MYVMLTACRPALETACRRPKLFAYRHGSSPSPGCVGSCSAHRRRLVRPKCSQLTLNSSAETRNHGTGLSERACRSVRRQPAARSATHHASVDRRAIDAPRLDSPRSPRASPASPSFCDRSAPDTPCDRRRSPPRPLRASGLTGQTNALAARPPGSRASETLAPPARESRRLALTGRETADRGRGRLLGLAELAQDLLERVDHFVAGDAAARETELQVEQLRRRPEREHVVLRPTRLRLGRLVAQLLPGAPPWPAIFSIRAVIFSGVSCLTTCRSNDLLEMSASRHRFRISSGMVARDSDSVMDVRDLPSRRARSSWV